MCTDKEHTRSGHMITNHLRPKKHGQTPPQRSLRAATPAGRAESDQRRGSDQPRTLLPLCQPVGSCVPTTLSLPHEQLEMLLVGLQELQGCELFRA